MSLSNHPSKLLGAEIPETKPSLTAAATVTWRCVKAGMTRKGLSFIIHIEIINGRIVIQEDWTEHGIAGDLEAAGVPKSEIVLGFQPPDVRPLTGYAVAA